MSKKQELKDALGQRMKGYEEETRTFLEEKKPTIMRLDGKAFHTYTQQFEKPFDPVLINTMDQTAIYLCSKIQGAQFAFVQSDEITIFLSDEMSDEAQLWYDGNVQKMVSVSASMAAAAFNRMMFYKRMLDITSFDPNTLRPSYNASEFEDIMRMASAEFDSRVFQVPDYQEVVNNFLWRQEDCRKNSISSVAQNIFSPKQLDKKNSDDKLAMCAEAGDPWDAYDPKLKWGRFIQKETYVTNIPYMRGGVEHIAENVTRSRWVSTECPLFREDKEFLLSRINSIKEKK